MKIFLVKYSNYWSIRKGCKRCRKKVEHLRVICYFGGHRGNPWSPLLESHRALLPPCHQHSPDNLQIHFSWPHQTAGVVGPPIHLQLKDRHFIRWWDTSTCCIWGRGPLMSYKQYKKNSVNKLRNWWRLSVRVYNIHDIQTQEESVYGPPRCPCAWERVPWMCQSWS